MDRFGALFLLGFTALTAGAQDLPLEPPPLINPAESTIQEHWQRLGLDYDDTARVISDRQCLSSGTEYVGCVQGLRAALAFGERKLTLVTAQHKAFREGRVQVIATFGPLKVGTLRAEERELSVLEALQENTSARTEDWLVLNQAYATAARDRTSGALSQLRAWIDAEIISELESEGLATAAVFNAYLGVTRDPHTYITPTAWINEDRTSDSFVGVGVIIRALQGKIVVMSPIEGGPALGAGVRARDIITHIDGEALNATTPEVATKKIRGEAGTTVTLTIRRGEEAINIRIVRARINQPNITAKVLSLGDQRVGYVKMNGFVDGSCQNLAEEISGMQGRISGLIWDLRDNGGGSVSEATCMLGIFLGAGRDAISYRNPETGEIIQQLQTRFPQLYARPLIVLINSSSASASELVSGALQDHQRAWIVGERSFGKGTVQQLEEGGDPWNLRGVTYAHTIARFHLPSGRSNQLVGIVPEIEAYSSPSPSEEDRVGIREEDMYLNAIAADGERPWTSPRVSASAQLKRCAQTSGSAVRRYEADAGAAIPPDYAIMLSQDLLACGAR
jgi:carboxyl-terminal processing protease